MSVHQLSIGAAAAITFSSFSITGVADAGVPTPQVAVGRPVHGLTAAQLQRFIDGKVQYEHTFLGSEGLGPVFNKESCGNCHNNPVGGTGSQTVLRAGANKKSGFDPLEEFGGSLFQQEAFPVECSEDPPAEATVTSLRVTNGMQGGYGLVQAILSADIEANADPTDSNADGISGKVHMVGSVLDGDLKAGRFGWKAQDRDIQSFSAGASFEEIGLTNPFHPLENDPNGVNPPAIEDCDQVPIEPGDTEVDMDFLDAVSDFQRFLTNPPQTPKSGMTGETIFNQIGCNQCHIASFTTSDDVAIEDALRDKPVKPYSDFLLHSMGLHGDGIAQGDGSETELKTPPLQGVRRRDPLWHDGRIGGGTFASRMTATIMEHDAFGSEATNAGVISDWVGLTQPQRDQVIQFLASLGQREFDTDGDDDLQWNDYDTDFENDDFLDCYGAGPYTADDPCAIHDIDQDGDVDNDDYSGLTVAHDCPTDFDSSGQTGFFDLTDILLHWGGCAAPCPWDTDGTGDVGFGDLTEILLEWGACPDLDF